MSIEQSASLLRQISHRPRGAASADQKLALARQTCPVQRDTTAGTFILTGYEDVRAVLCDNSLWRDPLKARPAEHFQRHFADMIDQELPRGEATAIVMLDEPDHSRIRAPLAQALYRRLARIRPALQALTDQQIDALRPGESVDLVSRLCRPLPVATIALILGVDRDRLDEFRYWSEGIVQGLNPYRSLDEDAQLEAARVAVDDYFARAMAQRRIQPTDDLISDLVHLKGGSEPISDGELRMNLGALLLGGNLTTADLIATSLYLMLSHPDQIRRLQTDRGLLSAAVEESLRLEPPVDITSRIASRDLRVGGVLIQAGEALLLSLRSANRDPAAFEAPDRFDIGLKRRPHVSFGGGGHICIGSPVARLQTQMVLERLLTRFPDLKLVQPSTEASWHTLPFFRGLQSLIVHL